MRKIASRALSGDSEYRLAFKVELARGGSHIASTLTPASMDAAVAEVMGQFIADRGTEGFEAFRVLLAENLEARGYVQGAEAVRMYVRKQRFKI